MILLASDGSITGQITTSFIPRATKKLRFARCLANGFFLHLQTEIDRLKRQIAEKEAAKKVAQAQMPTVTKVPFSAKAWLCMTRASPVPCPCPPCRLKDDTEVTYRLCSLSLFSQAHVGWHQVLLCVPFIYLPSCVGSKCLLHAPASCAIVTIVLNCLLVHTLIFAITLAVNNGKQAMGCVEQVLC